MTIKQTVKQVLTQVSGNKVFTANTITEITEHYGDTYLTPEQSGRVLRDLNYVKSVGRGKYIVKGRRVPV